MTSSECSLLSTWPVKSGIIKLTVGVPEAALSAEEAALEAEVLSEAEPPQPASMAADIASAIERASAFFIFVFLLFV
jgi:hypothetical protein